MQPGISVELSGVVKAYGTALALDGAALTLRPGLLHAVVGENGAGKSTLLKVAAGSVIADAGTILVAGRPLMPATPREAIRRGVGMVHQHFMLVPTLTGLENLALGEEPTRWGVLDLGPLEARFSRLANDLSLPVRLDVPVGALTVGERQRLEIVRVLARGAGALILDEPTAVLAPAEARAVLALARRLARDGASVALVTHRLDEVVEYADEVTVLRRGRVVAHHPPDDPAIRDARQLAREALGDEPIAQVVRAQLPAGEAGARIELRDVRLDAGELGGAPLRGVSLRVASGEVVGVAGVEGNGQLALELAIAGLARVEGGAITIAGADVTRADVRSRRARGLTWIPSDRHRHGIAEDLPVTDVLRLGALAEGSASKAQWVDEAALLAAHQRAVRDFDLRPNDPTLLAGALSGGNQQKIVVARELRGEPSVVLAAHPTRGVDARVAAVIRARLVDVAARGAAVVVISSDLGELRDLSNRIVVIRAGVLVAELPPTADVDAIGAAMLGSGASRPPPRQTPDRREGV